MGSRGRRIATVLVIDGDRLVTTLTVDAAAPDLDLVDTLARLALAARRVGWVVRLEAHDPALISLLRLVGLGDVFLPA